MESSSSSVIVSKGVQNPFTLKVGQVFTGFGVGCGLRIGVGRPLNLGAIPVLRDVMVAARGASDVFSGVGRHVNNSLKMVGARNIEAGIGCGVGFGHGFGVDVAIKPGVVHQIQTSLVQTATKLMTRFGLAPGVISLQSGNSIMNLTTESRTDKVINNFLQSPLLEAQPKTAVGELQSEKDVIQLVWSISHIILVLKQVALEKLKEENEKLQQILVEDLGVSPDKLKVNGYYNNNNTNTITNTCSDCFECRRRQRRDRLRR